MNALLAASALVVGLLSAAPAGAQISGASVSTAGSTGNSGNSDGSTRSSAGVLVNNGSTLQTRFAWNVSADVGAGSTRDQSGSAQHNISFSATAPGGYRLSITSQRTGMLQRNNDVFNCNGQAHTSGTTGSSNVALSTGSLTFGSPADIGNGSSTTQIPFNQTTSAQIFRVSNGSALGHSLTFTWNGSVRSNSCEAAVRQGEGTSVTSCGACEYPGSPSRTQSGDGHFVTIAYTSLCGNGVIDSAVGEQCDAGGANGSGSSCCNSNCTFRAAGAVCRGSAGECDPQETCPANPGTAGACPADAKTPNGTACSSDGNPCTLDQCNGSAATCQHPAGNAGALCRASAGVCDVAETCTGASTTCPGDGFASVVTPCRAAAGECDLPENCSGTGPSCPADSKKPNGTACTADSNPCSLDQCNGSSDLCQHPAGNAGAICRTAAGDCDIAETCTGASTVCPVDGFQSSSTVCRPSAGDCDLTESCTGSSAACPADALAPSSTVCRGSAGVCDVAENCTGGSPVCPGDGFEPSSTVCRGAADVCDVAESCTGSGPACPADGFQSSSTTCRPSAGDCDPAENCTGSAADCPADALEPASTVCRASAGDCDVAESCTGSTANCPADGFQPSSTLCRPSAGDCDLAESCTGSAAACPADGFQPSSTVCRAAAGVCDLAESCTGSTATCPADAKSTATCRPSAGDCDLAESCDGAGNDCPADGFEPASTVCRGAAGPCDIAENCTGSSSTCPSDAFEPGSTVCRPSAGICDVSESCTGSGAACPVDGFEPATTECRAAADVCDVAEDCTGSSAACPADGFEPSSTVCRASAGDCDVDESCTGSGVACPADGFEPATTVCRPAANPCDNDELCTGAGATCPADTGEPDGDTDTVCDNLDNCVSEPNPTQDDGDNDGDGDACDACNNINGVYGIKPKLLISRINTPAPDDRLKLKALSMPQFPPLPIDPRNNNGIRVIIQDALGNSVVDAHLPPGQYDENTQAGWRGHNFPKGSTWTYFNFGPPANRLDGITRAKVVAKNPPIGIVKFTIKGADADYNVPAANLPLKVIVVLDPPLATTGLCVETDFASAPLSCVHNPGSISCR